MSIRFLEISWTVFRLQIVHILFDPISVPNYPTCQSPIFNYIEKLRLDDSLNDDLEDINNLIDTEVGVENLQQNQYVEDPATAAGLMVSSFRPQESSSTKVKVETCRKNFY